MQEYLPRILPPPIVRASTSHETEELTVPRHIQHKKCREINKGETLDKPRAGDNLEFSKSDISAIHDRGFIKMYPHDDSLKMHILSRTSCNDGRTVAQLILKQYPDFSYRARAVAYIKLIFLKIMTGQVLKKQVLTCEGMREWHPCSGAQGVKVKLSCGFYVGHLSVHIQSPVYRRSNTERLGCDQKLAQTQLIPKDFQRIEKPRKMLHNLVITPEKTI